MLGFGCIKTNGSATITGEHGSMNMSTILSKGVYHLNEVDINN